jgi:tetratricopeptide (TPR) repeat protein
VIWSGGGWALKDLGSTNGTKLNHLKISDEIKLNEGDRITIGHQTFIFAEHLEKKGQEAPLAIKDGKPQTLEDAPPPMPLKKQETKDRENQKTDTKSNAFSFFNKNKQPEEKHDKETKHASPVFYATAILLTVILIGGFLLVEKIFQERNTKKKTVKSPLETGTPLTVMYEKQISTPDNIFRYELKIKTRIITIERDDLKHQIKFRRQQEVAPELLENLMNEIKETDFVNLPQQQPGISHDNSDETKTLTVAYGKSLNTVRIKNTFEPAVFREAVNVIEDFSNNTLNISTMSRTPEEMKKEAEKAFSKAELLFANRRASSENLKEAIKRYSYVIELLSFFEPKPEMHDKAYQQSQEAKKLLDEEVKAHLLNAQQASKLQRYNEAIEEYRKITEMLEPDDKRYQNAKNKIIAIEKHLRAIRKSK